MRTITISLSDSDDETIEAEYHQIEGRWVTFKTDDHKTVAAYPEARVTRIKSEGEKPGVTVTSDPMLNIFTVKVSKEFALSRGFTSSADVNAAITTALDIHALIAGRS